jgi:hypothetical protein
MSVAVVVVVVMVMVMVGVDCRKMDGIVLSSPSSVGQCLGRTRREANYREGGVR